MRKINSHLWLLFWTQFTGALNDNIFKNALVILITFEGASLFGLNTLILVALAGAVFIAPFFFLSATSGQLADAYDKIWLVKIIKQVEIGIMILAVIAFSMKNYYLLFLVLFLLGVHSSFFGPLKYALIPFYSTKNDLVFSNALISGGTFVAILVGTILGGMTNGIYLNSLLIIVALFGWYTASKLPTIDHTHHFERIKVCWNFNIATREILRILFSDKRIGFLALGLSWFWFMGAGLLSLIPILAKDILHGNHSIATLLLFTFTLGMGIGPFVLEVLTKGKIKKMMIPISLFLMSLFIFDLSFVISAFKNLPELNTADSFLAIDNTWRLIIDLFLLSFFGGIYTVTQFSELQRIAPSDKISRIVAGNNVLNALFMVAVSLLLMIFFKLLLSLWYIFFILGLLNLVVCIAMVFFYRQEFSWISKP